MDKPLSTQVDAEVRIAAFDWLRRKVEALGDVLPRDILAQGFDFQGKRVPLVGPQGMPVSDFETRKGEGS